MAKHRKMKHRRKNKKRRIPLFVKILFFFCFLFLVFLCFYFGSGIGGRVNTMYKEAKQLVADSSEETFQASQTSSVYDSQGNLLSTLSGDKTLHYLASDDIPKHVKNAFICTEDKKFYYHRGVDYKAVVRAALSFIKNREITQGGSTITQQLSRNIFLSHEVSWERKAKEIFIAQQLEKKYDKKQILEYYINNIYFANGNYGIEAASIGYFNKGVDELSLSQIAFLCSIPNNPTLYDPIDHIENTLKRRDRILKQMYADEYITKKEYQEALKEEITLDIPVDKRSNYVETFVYYCATRALMEKNGFEFRYNFSSDKERATYDEAYNSAYATTQKTLFTSGYQIYTSIDLDMQAKLQKAVDEQLADFTDVTDDGVYKLQASASCIDNSTGLVTAIVGGRTQDFSGYTLNRAYQSHRQPGSAIKPLIVYTPILEEDYNYTADTIVSDTKIKDGPSNSGDSYEGDITLRRAVAKSKNTVAWNLFKELTPKKGLSYLTKMEFSKIVDDDYYLPSALGGFTKGTSSVEMSGGYATLANGGIFRTPTCIVLITDSNGKTVYKPKEKGTQVYEERASYAMTDLLQSVMTEGTGRSLRLDNMPSAGKTGTTNDNKDGWFAGYTPYYTASVWVGYDIPKKLSGLQGASYPGKIWQQFMNSIHEGLEYKEFPEVPASKKDNTPAPATPAGADTDQASAAPAPSAEPVPTESAKPTATPKPSKAPDSEGGSNSEDGNDQPDATTTPGDNAPDATTPAAPTDAPDATPAPQPTDTPADAVLTEVAL